MKNRGVRKGKIEAAVTESDRKEVEEEGREHAITNRKS